MLGARQRERLAQRGVGAMCVLLIVSGAAYLQAGNLDYPNWWGGRVFAPFAIVIGGLGLIAIGARAHKMGLRSQAKAGRIRPN